jgi:DNA-binding transcriptional MerR regulator
MSGEDRSSPARLLPVGRVAAALGVSVRHVHRLVDRGLLAPPEKQAGRYLWSSTDVERARQQRLEHRPTNRHHARKAPDVARRLRQDRRVLAFALLDALNDCGVPTVLDTLRRHGAAERWRDLGLGQLSALAAELHALSRLARGVR